ncbi:transposase family protein [Streptomyces mirabilis]|uniref:transposase family protein n=1 Tax=Streptomyces mirabilis TaxID=68239 RepID=UPI003713EA32
MARTQARTTAAGAACPGCGRWSIRIHGSCLRFPGDLPTAGKRIVLSLRVLRFTCVESSCPRRTFAKQVPGLTHRYGGRTESRAAGWRPSVSAAGPAPRWLTPSGRRSAGTLCCG